MGTVMTLSIASIITALLSLVLNIVTAEVMEAEQVQDSLETYMNLDQVETVEGFMRTREFKAIVGGCACFWGSIPGMGMTYMLVVLLKRSFEPQEIAKEED